ncbi:MAG: DUF1214 domain-containing protein [Myxococcota bacterium]
MDKVARTISGALWNDFCDELKRAGETILRPEVPTDPLDRAEGFRYLTRILRLALETNVENAEPRSPRLALGCRPDVKLGCDNPDSHYLTALLDGGCTYRLRGRLGSVPFLSIGAYFGGMGSARSGCSGSLEGSQLVVGGDGRFEIGIAAERQAGNWLPLDAEAGPHQLVVRQTFSDRRRQRVAELDLERIDGPGGAPPLDAAAFHDRLLAAAAYVRSNTALFADWARDFQAHPNALRPLDVSRAQGDPSLFYLQGYWSLGPEEAWLLEFRPPACDYWNFQLNNYWLESLEHRDHRIDVNGAAAKREADGRIRIVVAHRDPGHPNWIETAGHAHGTMGLRIVKGREQPVIEQRVVPFDRVPPWSGRG